MSQKIALLFFQLNLDPSLVSILLNITQDKFFSCIIKTCQTPFIIPCQFSFLSYHFRQMMPLFCLGFTLIFPSLLLRQMVHSSSGVPSSVCSCLSAPLIYERNGVNQSSLSLSTISTSFSCSLTSLPHNQNSLPTVHSHSPAGSISVAVRDPELKYLQQPDASPASSPGPVHGRPYTLILCFSVSRLEKLCCSEIFLLGHLQPTLQALANIWRRKPIRCLKYRPPNSPASNFVSLTPVAGISLSPSVSSTVPGLDSKPCSKVTKDPREKASWLSKLFPSPEPGSSVSHHFSCSLRI